jgi:hypothetical protein
VCVRVRARNDTDISADLILRHSGVYSETVSWVRVQCNVDVYQRFGETCLLYPYTYTEGESRMFV